MKTVNDILDSFYSIVNASTVTNICGGSVYRIKKPIGNQVQDIVLLPLSVNGDESEIVQDGTLMINSFCQNHLKTGQPNEAYFKSITDAVISVLDGYTDVSTYFVFDIISQNILDDESDNKMSFSNLRINYWIEF